MNFWRTLRRFFSGQVGREPDELAQALTRHRAAFGGAMIQIRAFYAFLLFVVINDVPLWWFLFGKSNFVSIWPTAWVSAVGLSKNPPPALGLVWVQELLKGERFIGLK